jgi:hypothetical protein
MQFGLGPLLTVVTVISILCGLIVAAPPIAGAPLLFLVVVSSPSIWIAGIVYARGQWQAFFIGGVISGIAPWIAVFYWYGAIVLQLLAEIPRPSSALGPVYSPAVNSEWVLSNALTLVPGIASFFGGGLSTLVCRAFRPENGRMAAP